MKNKIFTYLFLLFVTGSSVFSQTVNVTITYSGAQSQGCCNVCGVDYWCINNTGGCGTTAACDNRTFFDPVPAGNIVTGVSVTYFGAGCYASAEPTFINGVLIGSAPNDGNCACGGCSSYPISNTFPCPTGIPSYNYGGANVFRSCPNGAFCPQRAVITLTYTPVSTAPTAATATPNPSCGGPITLNKVGGTLGTGAVWKWYSGSCGGTLEGTGASITVTPTSTTTYFIRAEGGGCGTSTCAQVTVTFNTLSVDPTSATASPSTTCGGATTLSVVGGSLGSGSAWNWYSASCGGAAEGTGASITVSPTATTTYFVRAVGPCNTTNCVSVVVTVNPVPFAIATPASQTICSGSAPSIALTSFVPGTTFAWTVVHTGGVTGGTNNSGATIAETLTAGGTQGTAVYTVTPTANGCSGNPINVTITVDPIPVLTATPLNQTICAGAVVPINLTSTVSGTVFSWTVVETGVSGGSNSTGNSIADTLVATGGGTGTAVYTITATSSGCPAAAITATITVNPDPGSTATASPAISTICSGTSTSIALSSIAIGTVFTWTVVESGVTGGSGGTGATISQILNAGIVPGTATYSVTSTANGCTGNPITVSVTVNPTPVGTATPNSQTFCSGDTTSIALTSNVPGTVFPWTVFQSGGVTGGTFGNDSVIAQTLTNPGTSSGTAVYTVVPTVYGCAGTPVVVTITVNPMDDASFVYSSATYCLSGNDPTPSITGLPGGVFSSTPPGLSINPTTGTINLATSSTGTYQLCYSTTGICSDSSCITMTIDNSTPFAGFTYQGGPFCQNGINPLPVFGTGASAGVFSVSPIGLQFIHINTGEIDLINSAPGTYTVTNSIPPSGPCGAVTATTTVVIIASDDASFVYTSATYCTTGSPQTPVVTGLSGGTFSSTPAGLTLNPSTGTITLSSSAYGVYMLTYTTNGACPNADSITMTIDTITPSASFTYVGSPFCQNGINPFPFFGPNASAGIFSATPSGLVFAHVNTGEIDLINCTPGTYVVTNTIPASGICLPISDTYTVTITPSDDASFTYSSATYCTSGANPTPSITGMPGGIFSSVPPGLILNATTGTITLSSSTIGTYTLTYSTNGGCPNTSSIVMTIADSTPFANFSYSSPSFCQNAINQYPTFIPGASAGIFSVTPAGLVIVHVNTGEIDLLNSAPGTYIVTNTIPASGQCTAVSATTTVIVNPADDAAFTYPSATYCTTGSPQTPTITGLPGGTFSSVPSGLTLNPSTGTITLTTSVVGSYTLSYTTFGACPNTSSITMTINDTMSAAGFSYIGSPFCQSGGTNIFPTFDSGASAGIFSATPSGLVFAHVNTGEIDMALSAPGIYIVTNTIPISGSCAFVSANFTITISAAPIATATASSLAFCGTGTSAVSIVLTSTIPGTTFAWTVAQAGVTGGSPGTGATISQTLTNQTSPASAIYTITPEANGCPGLPITVNIIISPSIVDTASVVIVPANCGTTTGSISGITMTSGQSPFSYQWTDSLNAPVGGGGADLNNVGPGNYSVTITDANGCSIVVGPFAVNATQAVVAAFTPNPLTGETPLTVNFTNNSIGAATYVWQFGTGDSSTVMSPAYVYNPLGTFTVCLTAISASNCIDTACSTINIFINSVFIIPNIFTPNGDGINDIFTVQAVGLKTMDAEIFNRWGHKEYEWHTTNGGWDGHTASGVLSPNATYYYIISATGIDGKKYSEKGYFTLTGGK